MSQDIQLQCKGEMCDVAREAIDEAQDHYEITLTKYQERGSSVFLLIPVSEANAWVRMLTALANEEKENEAVDRSLFDDLATAIKEEAEKKTGKSLEEFSTEAETAAEPIVRSRNFWKGI